MTAEASKRLPPTPDGQGGEVEDLRHYRPEELVDPEGEFRLPTTARMLRVWAHARKIPHNGMGKRITFTRADIRAISAQFAVPPMSETKRRKSAAA